MVATLNFSRCEQLTARELDRRPCRQANAFRFKDVRVRVGLAPAQATVHCGASQLSNERIFALATTARTGNHGPPMGLRPIPRPTKAGKQPLPLRALAPVHREFGASPAKPWRPAPHLPLALPPSAAMSPLASTPEAPYFRVLIAAPSGRPPAVRADHPFQARGQHHVRTPTRAAPGANP
jgi:hypothetical protein